MAISATNSVSSVFISEPSSGEELSWFEATTELVPDSVCGVLLSSLASDKVSLMPDSVFESFSAAVSGWLEVSIEIDSSWSKQSRGDTSLSSDSTSLGFTEQNSNWTPAETTGFSSFTSLASSARSVSLSEWESSKVWAFDGDLLSLGINVAGCWSSDCLVVELTSETGIEASLFLISLWNSSSTASPISSWSCFTFLATGSSDLTSEPGVFWLERMSSLAGGRLMISAWNSSSTPDDLRDRFVLAVVTSKTLTGSDDATSAWAAASLHGSTTSDFSEAS